MKYFGFFIIIMIIAFLVWIKTPRGKGQLGEFIIKLLIGKTKEGERYVINNFMIELDGKSSQLDHILINQFGIFVIETKNYSGRIYGKENELNWTQVLSYGKVKHKIYNPVKQNNTHIYRLKKYYLRIHLLIR